MENINFDEIKTKNPKNIAVIGTGYVGLPSAAVFAKWGNNVTAVDVDVAKVQMINSGKMPIYEENVEEFIQEALANKNFIATTDYALAVKDADVVFIAVGTPATEIGTADMKYIDEAAFSIGQNLSEGKYTVVVTKSTVPVGTNKRVTAGVLKGANGRAVNFDVASNPEFLREGYAVYDSYNGERVVIGSDSEKALDVLSQIFEHLDTIIFKTDVSSSELIKYAANTFLTTKITFINEIANLCERVGADVKSVAEGIGLDARIGKRFLNPTEIGFGGPCFPKDVNALYQLGLENNYEFQILGSVINVNEQQMFRFIDRVTKRFGSNLENITLGVLGTAFKDNTDDARHSGAIDVIRQLRGFGAQLKVYDPMALATAKQMLGEQNIEYLDSYEKVFDKTDAVIILTEWKQFKDYDYENLVKNMHNPVIFDARYMLDPNKAKQSGIEYYSRGRKVL